MSITQLARNEINAFDATLLERCRSRAAVADERNEFFHEDLAELRDIG